MFGFEGTARPSPHGRVKGTPWRGVAFAGGRLFPEGGPERLGLRRRRRAEVGRERGLAPPIDGLDFVQATKMTMRAHEAAVDVLGTRVHAERVFVPVHGLLPIDRLALPRGANDLPEQPTAQTVSKCRSLGRLGVSLVEE